MAVDSGANTRLNVENSSKLDAGRHPLDSSSEITYLFYPDLTERSGYASILIDAADGLCIDDRQKLVYVDGHPLLLSRKEYTLLILLAKDPGRVVSNEEIVLALWPDNVHHTACDVKQFVYLLRRRIEKDPGNPRWIQSVRGFGYKLGSPTIY